jgi:hypothetical protein
MTLVKSLPTEIFIGAQKALYTSNSRPWLQYNSFGGQANQQTNVFSQWMVAKVPVGQGKTLVEQRKQNDCVKAISLIQMFYDMLYYKNVSFCRKKS